MDWIWLIAIAAAGVALLAMLFGHRLSGTVRPVRPLYEEMRDALRRLQHAAAAPFADPAENGGVVPAPPHPWRDATIAGAVRLSYRIERAERGYRHVVTARSLRWGYGPNAEFECVIAAGSILARQLEDAGIPLAAANLRSGIRPGKHGRGNRSFRSTSRRSITAT